MSNSKHAKICTCFVIILTAFMLCNVANAETPIFPGAKGFGTNTRAAYGAANNPVICIVDTLAHRRGMLSLRLRSGGTENGSTLRRK